MLFYFAAIQAYVIQTLYVWKKKILFKQIVDSGWYLNLRKPELLLKYLLVIYFREKLLDFYHIIQIWRIFFHQVECISQ